MPDEILLERMTWPEVQAALKDGYDTVVLFAGSIEQHGPHLPLCTDTMLGYELAERVARKMSKALAAPVIRPGLSEHHMAFKGTITLSHDTFTATVRDYVRSLARHGFKHLAITYSHGGNAGALDQVLPELAKEFPSVEILTVVEGEAFSGSVRDIYDKAGIDESTAGVHAGEFETSCMLAYDEEMVRMDKLAKGYTGDFSEDSEALTKMLQEGLHTATDNGILGDARPAEKERGERYLDAVASYIATHFVRVEA
jgi:creatinine amidohydrolase